MNGKPSAAAQSKKTRAGAGRSQSQLPAPPVDLLRLGLEKTGPPRQKSAPPPTSTTKLCPHDKNTQAYRMYKFFQSKSLLGLFNKLPPNDMYTFRAIGQSRIKEKNMLDTKLFLGETPTFQTWAVVKVFESGTKATEVAFINEYATGEKDIVSAYSKMALMYPFKVFKTLGTVYSMRQLKHLIMFVYLDTGAAETLFPDGFHTARAYLSSGIKRISDAYDQKGIESIPDLHPPSSDFAYQRHRNAVAELPRTDAVYDDNAVTAGEGTVRGGEESLDDDDAELASVLESVNIHDHEPFHAGTKRRAVQDEDDDEAEEIDDSFAEFALLRRQHELDRRTLTTCRNKRVRLEVSVNVLEKRVKENKMRQDEILASITGDEAKQWLTMQRVPLED